MNIIKTKSFELAVNSQGDLNSEKLAIVLPGRLDTKDYDCFNQHLKCLSNKGFYAISIDPPGTWESPGDISLFTTSNYIKAVNELIEYYGNKPTLLLGHSRGGAIADLVGTENPLIKAIITINASFGPPTPPSPQDKKRGFRIEYRDLPPGDKKTFNQKRFEFPLNYFKDGNKYDDAEVLKACVKPKLIFYAIDDEFNSPEDVDKVYASLSEPKIFYKLRGSHNYRYYPDVVKEVNHEIELFINKFFSS